MRLNTHLIRSERPGYFRISFLSVREWPIDGDGDGDIVPRDEPTVPLCIPPFGPAVPLFMPDFDVSFDDGLTLGLESLLAPAAVPEPAPAPATPGVFCAKAAPEIIVRQVAAMRSFFI
jgi:hypothetical protein